jgi:translation elongation factor EF-G
MRAEHVRCVFQAQESPALPFGGNETTRFARAIEQTTHCGSREPRSGVLFAESLAFKDAVAKARPVLLEPVMAVECTTPAEYQGDLIGDLNRRRGTVREVEAGSSVVTIRADVPLAEMFGYANAIRSLSKGRAEYSMVPARFEEVPEALAAKVLAKR